MGEAEEPPALKPPPDSPKLAAIVAQVTQVTQVTQGTQVGTRPARPAALRHHASEALLSSSAARPPLRAPVLRAAQAFYTHRSGQPFDGVYNTAYSGFPGPGMTQGLGKTRRRGQLQPYSYPQDSPTSSLDCLAVRSDAWSTDPVYQGKMNGMPTMEDRRGGSGASSKSCRCSCRCGEGGGGGGGGGEEQAPAPNSPEALSWRRLHMSRAKLKATATTSELLSGFAMIAMVELQINEPTNVPEWLFVMFAVCTTVLVAVHIFALMISTYLLPNIDAASKMSTEDVLRESPHERMRGFIELAWAFSTVLGLFLFLVEIAILCWVKFWDYSFAAATAATVIVIPVLIVFVAFAVHFYHSLVIQKCEASTEDLEQLESIKRNLDSATTTGNSPV